MPNFSSWKRFADRLVTLPSLGITLDASRMNCPERFLAVKAPAMKKAFVAMRALEKGALANPDEQRKVGHYWLRAPDLAPDAATASAIRKMREAVRRFAKRAHSGALTSVSGKPFTDLLLVGIGGSALGPQLVAAALGHPARDRLRPWFFDNTDPDGMDTVLAELGARLRTTLVVVISKSGGTKETRNGMIEARRALEKLGIAFSCHAVAVTSRGSELSKLASAEGWLAEFPMWDWVGGRTSQMSAVGLLPAALQGLDVDSLLEGARLMDEATRIPEVRRNPAALLALMWLHATRGRGARDMVLLPYKDRLLLLSRYLQQLVMESLGKERDLRGRLVNQGIAVYGNKGSTDQHAYVQQLRDGVDNFFVTFVRVLRDRASAETEVEPGVTSGDYLHGFLLGTRAALAEKKRLSLTLTLSDLSPKSLGATIALFERAVGFYASLVGINAYHQPGVEAGKKAATEVLELQGRVIAELRRRAGQSVGAEALATALGADPETVFLILDHLAANPERGVHAEGSTPSATRFFAKDGKPPLQ
ncbi:MAG: glucose-6-phosphate isomerase [Verrucomicrobiae bacterium]|nr:glucose-6-phosphate isomerase [Verrucomicrobiae bacterium]